MNRYSIAKGEPFEAPPVEALFNKVPKKGDEIYVPSEFYIDHGEDDFVGGLATVSKISTGISGGIEVHFISVRERPGHGGWNWERYLREKQEKLKAEFGSRRAYADPDDHNPF